MSSQNQSQPVPQYAPARRCCNRNTSCQPQMQMIMVPMPMPQPRPMPQMLPQPMQQPMPQPMPQPVFYEVPMPQPIPQPMSQPVYYEHQAPQPTPQPVYYEQQVPQQMPQQMPQPCPQPCPQQFSQPMPQPSYQQPPSYQAQVPQVPSPYVYVNQDQSKLNREDRQELHSLISLEGLSMVSSSSSESEDSDAGSSEKNEKSEKVKEFNDAQRRKHDILKAGRSQNIEQYYAQQQQYYQLYGTYFNPEQRLSYSNSVQHSSYPSYAQQPASSRKSTAVAIEPPRQSNPTKEASSSTKQNNDDEYTFLNPESDGESIIEHIKRVSSQQQPFSQRSVGYSTKRGGRSNADIRVCVYPQNRYKETKKLNPKNIQDN